MAKGAVGMACFENENRTWRLEVCSKDSHGVTITVFSDCETVQSKASGSSNITCVHEIYMQKK